LDYNESKGGANDSSESDQEDEVYDFQEASQILQIAVA
jgi:hypothetical protein